MPSHAPAMLDRPMLVLSLLMLLLVGIAVVAVAATWPSVTGPIARETPRVVVAGR